MWVVKLGGSLLGSPELPRWLDMLAKHGDGRIVIVPGGGIFANAVREAQALTHIDDATAHHLSLLAMDQYGLLLNNLCPQLATASCELELSERSWQHRAIVWLPSHMVLADDTIPCTWDVTSDSLAAWLACKMNAERLILIKSINEQSLDCDGGKLVQHNIVDKHLPCFVGKGNFECWVASRSSYHAFENALLEGGGAGVRVCF